VQYKWQKKVLNSTPITILTYLTQVYVAILPAVVIHHKIPFAVSFHETAAGYSCFCVAKAMTSLDISLRETSVEGLCFHFVKATNSLSMFRSAKHLPGIHVFA
jgi:hypothetical protein